MKKPSSFITPAAGNQVRQILQPWKFIWRIGKNNIIFYCACFQECLYINMYRFDIFKIKILYNAFNP